MAGKTGDNIKVSIIMPAFNHARWVRQAMESVLAQTVFDFEFIVIDDASSDATWEVIQAVCSESGDLRLQCIRHASNQGAPATINEGLRHAQGDYLAIINSDDVWELNRLERLLAVAQSEAAGFISSDVSLLDADSLPCESAEPHWVSWFEGLKAHYVDHHDIFTTLLRGNCLITTSNFFFHRRVYECVGEFADLRYVHDYDYALRVLTAGFRVHFLHGEKLLGYRLHGANTIREKPLAAIEENMRLLLNWLPYLEGGQARLGGVSSQLLDLYRYTREEWLTIVHERLVAREQELLPLIADRDRWVADRDTWIRERDIGIENLQKELQQHRQWVAERDALISRQVDLLAERDRRVCDRDAWIHDRDGWIAERDALILHLQQQQSALRNSRAFRLGESLLAPLRYLRQLAGGMGDVQKTDTA